MTRSNYHRPGLRAALISTGLELARADGPAAVVLREAARRLEVSPTAAYRHFRDREDLLLAVRHQALGLLGQRMMQGQQPATDPLLRFRELGQAYVQFALDEPGLFRTLSAAGVPVRPEQPDPDPDPFRLLAQALDALVDAQLLAPSSRLHADAAAWSAVHGLSALLLDDMLPRQDAAALTNRVLEVVAFGLLPTPSPCWPR